MKYITYFFAILLFWSCDTKELEKITAFPENAIKAPVLQPMETVVIDQDSYDAEALVTFSWQPADFGYNAAVSYSIYLSSSSVPDYALASNVKLTSFTIDHQALYDKLAGENNLALPLNQASTISVYVTATVGSDFKVVKSDVKNVIFDVSKISLDGDLLSISGEFNGGSTTRAAITGKDKVYSGYVDMNWKDHESTTYKFVDFLYSSTNGGDWYGGSLDALSTSGDYLTSAPGMKFFRVDLNTKIATIVNFTKVGLTGVNGAWGTPAVEMSYDFVNKYYFVVKEVDTRSFRILCGTNWSYTMGPKIPEDLSLRIGSDVKVFDNSISKPLLGKDPNMALNEAGTYKFIFYFSSTDATWHFKVEKP